MRPATPILQYQIIHELSLWDSAFYRNHTETLAQVRIACIVAFYHWVAIAICYYGCFGRQATWGTFLLEVSIKMEPINKI